MFDNIPKLLKPLNDKEGFDTIVELLEAGIALEKLYEALKDGVDIGDLSAVKYAIGEIKDFYDVREKFLAQLKDLTIEEVEDALRPLSTELDARLYGIVVDYVKGIVLLTKNTQDLLKYIEDNKGE